MEKFVDPTNVKEFIKWILKKGALENWKLLVEYSDRDLLVTLTNNAVLTDLPQDACFNYSHINMLAAFNPVNASVEYAQLLIENSHVLSVYKNDQLQLLIADDYHMDCFSCTAEFYEQHELEWKRMKLIKA